MNFDLFHAMMRGYPPRRRWIGIDHASPGSDRTVIFQASRRHGKSRFQELWQGRTFFSEGDALEALPKLLNSSAAWPTPSCHDLRDAILKMEASMPPDFRYKLTFGNFEWPQRPSAISIGYDPGQPSRRSHLRVIK